MAITNITNGESVQSVTDKLNDLISSSERKHKAGVGIVFVGDSLTEGAGTNFYSRIFGIMIKAGRRLTFNEGYNQGVGGDETQDVLDRIATIGASIQPIVSLQIGTNDVSQNVPVATYISNIRLIIKKLFQYGAETVFLHGFPTKFNEIDSNPWSPAQLALRDTYITALKDLDIDNVILDIDNSANFDMNLNTTNDGTHLSAWGSVLYGGLQADAILDYVDTANYYQDSINNLLDNPELVGTTGFMGGTSTGVCADDWIMSSNVSGATLVCSKTDDVFGDGTTAQTLTFSGVVSNNSDTNFRQTVTISASAGDIYLIACRFKVDAGHQGLSNIGVDTIPNNFTPLTPNQIGPEFKQGQTFQGVLISGVNEPLDGTETSLDVRLKVKVETGETVNCTVHFDSPILLKAN